jgi:hypothetical protein
MVLFGIKVDEKSKKGGIYLFIQVKPMLVIILKNMLVHLQK